MRDGAGKSGRATSRRSQPWPDGQGVSHWYRGRALHRGAGAPEEPRDGPQGQWGKERVCAEGTPPLLGSVSSPSSLVGGGHIPQAHQSALGSVELFELLFFLGGGGCKSRGILAPCPGIEPAIPALKTQGLNPCTARKLPFAPTIRKLPVCIVMGGTDCGNGPRGVPSC